MPKDTFFEDEDEDLEEDPAEEGGEDGEKTPPAKEEKGDAGNKAPEDKEDWKARFEALEAEREDSRYYEEMLRFNDELEGDTLDDLEGGKRYRELRKLGLSGKSFIPLLVGTGCSVPGIMASRTPPLTPRERKPAKAT